MATINLNINAPDELWGKLVAGLNEAGVVLTNACKQELTSMGGVDTGILRASHIHKVDAEDLSCTVGTNVEYAPYYHEGTGIYAKDGKGRKQVPWRYKTPDGKWHTTKGQKPHPYMENAFNNSVNEVRDCFRGCL